MEKKRFDCGILNFWHTCNYGALLTCYGLQESIKSFGYKPKVINYVHPAFLHKWEERLSCDFSQKHLDLTELCTSKKDLEKLNKQTDTFIAGSDQIWRYIYFWWQGKNIFQLDFADTNAKKIAYAASFGTDNFEGNDKDTSITKYYIKRFDDISVREDDGVDICKNTFDVNATHVLDPVFLLETQEWDKLINNSKNQEKGFVASYILDKSPHAEKLIKFTHVKFGKKNCVNMINASSNSDCKESVEDWLYNIKNCKFFITDSFHGACFAIIFNKPFICLANVDRGYSRFKSLFNMFGLQHRCILSANELENRDDLFEDIDYSKTNEILIKEKQRSINWLKSALAKEKSPASKEEKNRDIMLNYLLDEISSLYNENKQTLQNAVQICQYSKLKKKYYRYKLLRKITFGKTRKKYKEKYKILKQKVKGIKKLISENS